MRDEKYPREKNTAKRSFDLGLFKKKKLEDKVSFRIKMAEKISKHRIRYVSERIGDTDIIIGRDGDLLGKAFGIYKIHRKSFIFPPPLYKSKMPCNAQHFCIYYFSEAPSFPFSKSPVLETPFSSTADSLKASAISPFEPWFMSPPSVGIRSSIFSVLAVFSALLFT